MNWKTKLRHWVADRLPDWLVYLAANRAVAEYSTKDECMCTVPEICAVDVLKYWCEKAGDV